MSYMLDTNIVSELIRNPFGHAARRAREVSQSLSVSIIVASELRYGCAKKGSPELRRKVAAFLSAVPVMVFDVPADAQYGEMRAQLEAAGVTIGSNDLLIAAHARALGSTVVTANVREFTRIPGLPVENWLS
jgi:tRNA(fMet)-specific endonuclease VapC